MFFLFVSFFIEKLYSYEQNIIENVYINFTRIGHRNNRVYAKERRTIIEEFISISSEVYNIDFILRVFPQST